jgi:CSLREA domain-containing protein
MMGVEVDAMFSAVRPRVLIPILLLSLSAMAGVVVAGFGPPAGAAATFVVDTTDDTIDADLGDGICADAAAKCSLRAAVMQANATAGADAITVPSGTHTFTISGIDEDLSATGDLDITDDLTIGGAGFASTTIDAAGIDRVFHLPGGSATVTLSGVTITGGMTAELGGGVLVSPSQATLAIVDAVVSGNTAGSAGGGIFVEGSIITVTRTTLSGNRSNYGGGLLSHESTLTLDGSMIGPNNTADYAGGGLFIAYGAATVQNGTVVTGNQSVGDGGGIYIDSDSLTIMDSEISANTADSDADEAGDGGGIYSYDAIVTIDESSIDRNRAYDGGGIFLVRGSVAINDSTIADNDATLWGGGIRNVAGELAVNRATVASNTAASAAGIDSGGTTTVINSTISGNRALEYGAGGVGVWAGNASLIGTTVAFNTAIELGGGVFEAGGMVQLEGTIVAENVAQFLPDCVGAVTSRGYNLIGGGHDCPFGFDGTDLVGGYSSEIDPMLGPLQDNGGAVFTHALLSGSPALDAIPAARCALAIDTRGVSRPQGVRCDIGAFEATPFEAQPGDTVGLVDPATGRWHLRGRSGVVSSFFYGNPRDVPFVGDWDCDGTATPGLFRTSDAFAYLRNSNTQGIADIRFFFGNPSDVPLAGDFNGDGCDTLSIYRPSEQRFYIVNELGENDGGLGAADFSFLFGNPGDKPVVGDWDGDGIDEVGLHRESTGFFYWRNTLDTGVADGEIFFGDPGDRFVAGDWGIVDGKDTPGLFRPSNVTFYFRHTLTQGVADSSFTWEGAGPAWLPVAGAFGPG